MYYTTDFQRPMLLWLIALSVIFAAHVSSLNFIITVCTMP